MGAGGERPRVSVCIPVFDGRATIGQAVGSVLGQTFCDFELLVLDNRSTDGTPEAVAAFTDPRLRLVLNPSNLGMAGNFNRALELATGEFVKLLPADDFLYPACLERQVAALDRSPGAVMACCSRGVVGPAGKRILARSFPGGGGRRDGRAAIRKNIRAGTNLIGEPGAVLFRAEAARVAGGFAEGNLFVIDLDLWVRLLLTGDLEVVPEELCAFRVSPGSESVRKAWRQREDFVRWARGLPADTGITRADLAMGSLHAAKNMLLRQVFYRTFLAGQAKGLRRGEGKGAS